METRREDRRSFVQQEVVIDQAVHPDFDDVNWLHYNNIAVVTLENPLNFTTHYVRPVHLPTDKEVKRIKSGPPRQESLIVTGWGSPDGDHRRRGKSMLEEVITTFDKAYCDETYNGTGLTEGVGFTEGLTCGASPLSLAGACHGDDGSGLVQLDHTLRRFTLMAVLSDDIFDPVCGSRDRPNVFVRVWDANILPFLWREIFGTEIRQSRIVPVAVFQVVLYYMFCH